MKKTGYVLIGAALSAILLLLFAAAPPAPIWRNNFTTNQPPFPVIGDWNYSNANPAGLTTNFVSFLSTEIAGLRGGTAIWELFGWSSGNNVAISWNGSQSALFTNGSGLFAVQDASVIPLKVFGKTGQGVDYLQVLDGAGNVVAYMRSNVFWATTNDFFATLTTTDNTTNNIFTFTPRDNSLVRCLVDLVGYNSTASASYGKIGTFKSVAGTVTQVGSTVTIGSSEDDSAYESILDTSANTIRVRVAGNTGRTVKWKCYLNTIYSE